MIHLTRKMAQIFMSICLLFGAISHDSIVATTPLENVAAVVGVTVLSGHGVLHLLSTIKTTQSIIKGIYYQKTQKYFTSKQGKTEIWHLLKHATLTPVHFMLPIMVVKSLSNHHLPNQ